MFDFVIGVGFGGYCSGLRENIFCESLWGRRIGFFVDYLSGTVVQWSARVTVDAQVLGSNPGADSGFFSEEFGFVGFCL